MKILAALLILYAVAVFAAAPDDPAVAETGAAGNSVADNMRAMDTDHDGQISVTEIKAYLQKKYGADYQKDLLELMEKRAYAKSCGSSFTRDLE